jgi:hypothetical protein
MKRIAILGDPELAQILALWTHSQERMMSILGSARKNAE